jgi:hypothetical protein
VFGAERRPEGKADEAKNAGWRFRRPFFGSFFGRTKKEEKIKKQEKISRD